MTNKVRLHDFYIELSYVGDQSGETVREMLDHALRMADKVWGEGYPHFVLVDLNRLGKSTHSSRAASLNGLKRLSFAAVAVVSRRLFFRQLASLVIRASGRGSRVKVFSTKKTALSWLRELSRTTDLRHRSKKANKPVRSSSGKEG